MPSIKIAGILVLSFVSIITFSRRPDCSSASSRKVIPSMTLSKRTLPGISEMITALNGSHEQISSPFFSFWLFFTFNVEPYGISLVTNTVPSSSTIRISPIRVMTITCSSPSFVLNLVVRTLSNSILPSNLATICESIADELAAPPTWKVRSVSCVPGSPIDCAAIIPTASPD